MNEIQLNKLFSGLEAGLNSFHEIRKLYNEQMAFEFNSLNNFFWPNENKISHILAFFLNPNANHAQKDIFLKIFLEHLALKIDYLSTKPVKIYREKYTDENRRIDIVIKIATDEIPCFLIGIENKIYDCTQEQQDQLKHYADFLSKEAGKNFCLLYLTPSGSEASEHSISKGIAKQLRENNQLKEISYEGDIISIFEKFEVACKADNVRAFLKDFNHYLKQQYQGAKIMGEQDFIADYLFKSTENIVSSFKIANSIGILQNKLLKSLKEELDTFGIEKKMKVQVASGNIMKIWTDLCLFIPEGWKETKILFQFQSSNGKNLIFGIVRKEHNGVFQKFRSSNNPGFWCDATEHWPFNHKSSTYNNWSLDSPWIDIIKQNNNSSKMFNYITEYVIKIRNDVNEYAQKNNISL